MASLYECEVRYTIAHIESFSNTLRQLDARLVYPYAFTDYYFVPEAGGWDLLEKNLRIREWQTPSNPTTVYFVKNEIITSGEIQCKRALYPDGKVPLMSTDRETCARVLADLGFIPWITIRKEHASFWELPKHGFNTVTEYIEGIGWTGELEFAGDDVRKAQMKIQQALALLAIPKETVSFKPISAIYAERTASL
ncbi:MAG: hypothetical protein A3B31_01430 [Candidatus Komeilibacteria bacterium RIFCSPLOWO2_01_FULL_53_11]|uniref:CYTH domain-containing protein n=1 Tax=Candidatus Komeilibacteria bacterium RIFCSPLOWO2_01_FULL_53_11 TaxID=1798552 RepID=A0A1G2BRR3_9BACT|nr:MAG: hypothetical protein A3B31_01430 [Candidatus Komeilibacteria bacterium RIFCSPLOWO2_01_FULL_53_11]